MSEDHCFHTSCDALSCNPALPPVDMMTTNFCLIWLPDCSLSVCLSVKSWSLSPFSSHSFSDGSNRWERLEVYRKHSSFALTQTAIITMLLKKKQDRLTQTSALLTSESSVCSVGSPQDQTALSRLSPSVCFLSAAALSDGRGWTSELRPENHSWSLSNCSASI